MKSKFEKVRDARGHEIRGLWARNGRFYAQLRVPDKPHPVKLALEDEDGQPASSVAVARDALARLRDRRRTNCLPPVARTATLAEWVEKYLHWLEAANAKNAKTIKKERGHLNLWKEKFGFVRIAQLRRTHVNEFVEWRKSREEVSNRTINLDIIALNNALNHARHEGILQALPTAGWKSLEHISPKRPLWSQAEIDRLVEAALTLERDKQTEQGREGCGQMFADYVRFLAYSGARRNEAVNVSWEDVSWDRRVVTLSKTKYGHPRDVNFNPRLEALLKDMAGRKCGDSRWLFPSPRRGLTDAPIFTLQNTLYAAREAAGLTVAAGARADFRFHDARHFFISSAVMSGIDFMTIARWVGHKDGGVLIGKVYGHLNDEHTKAQAARMYSTPAQSEPVPSPIPGPDVIKLLQDLQAQVASLQAAKTV